MECTSRFEARLPSSNETSAALVATYQTNRSLGKQKRSLSLKSCSFHDFRRPCSNREIKEEKTPGFCVPLVSSP